MIYAENIDILFHVKRFTSKTQKIGEIGEKIAEMFLVKHGFTVIDRNFTHKLGEIDLVAKKSGKLYFFEVKAIVSRETEQKSIKKGEKDVSRMFHGDSKGHTNVVYKNQNDIINDIGINKMNSINDITVQISAPERTYKRHESQNDPKTSQGENSTNVVYNPLENISRSKIAKTLRAVQIYLAQKGVSRETPWQLDALGVILVNTKDSSGKTKITGNVTRIEHINIR